jgi:predicted MFS family arabinose efflux permease
VCFLINGFSFLAVIASLWAMRLPKFEPCAVESHWDHLVDGFSFAWSHRDVRRVLGLQAGSTLSGTPIVVLAPFFADDIFHRGSQGLGFLMGAMGIGAVVGTLVLARRTRTAGLSSVMTSSGFFVGAAYLAFGLSPSYAFSLAIMPVIGLFVMRQMASANTTIQTLIPDQYRGRTMALYSMTVVGLGPLGSLAAGAAASHIGPRPTVVVGAALALAAAAVFGWSCYRRPIAA